MDAEQYNAERVPMYAPEIDGRRFPEWTGVDESGYDFGSAEFRDVIRGIQSALEVTVDGYCGPSTIDAIAKEDLEEKRHDEGAQACMAGHHLLVGPRAVPVDVPTRLYADHFDMAETGSRARRTERDEVTQAIVHFDVTFDAAMTHRVLLDRGYSTHFTIDGDEDGTIWQHHNPATRICYHAGDSNRMSFGVDLNNPALPKYQKRDAERRGRRRDIVEQHVHGRLTKHLDYFPEQIASLNALFDELCPAFDVPRKCPRDEHGEPIHGKLDNPLAFEGVSGHYHNDRGKVDPAPLDWDEVCPA